MKPSIIYKLIFCGIFLSLIYCKKNSAPTKAELLFDSIPVSKILNPLIREVSGIADSKKNPGFLWAHEDSGNPPILYLINHNGQVTKQVFIKGVSNRDWEDMALCNNEIYIGELGDNAALFSSYTFYKFAEPTSNTDTVFLSEKILFNYPDGAHDAEAFLVDPVSSDVFIITKRDDSSKVYKLKYPYGATNTVSLVATLPYSGVVSAALSNDGKEILVKTYARIRYYQHASGQSISGSLKQEPKNLSFVVEPQGEAICFALDGKGYYTLSELAWASSVNLNFYKRH